MSQEIMPHDILYNAAYLIEQFGYCKHSMRDRKGHFCTLGAIQEAGVDAGLITHGTRFDKQPIIAQAMYALKKSIAEWQGGRPMNDYSHISIPGWNDYPKTTKQDVIDVMRFTADYIKEHGAPEVPKSESIPTITFTFNSISVDLSKASAALEKFSIEATITTSIGTAIADAVWNEAMYFTYYSSPIAEAAKKLNKKPQPSYVKLAEQAIKKASAKEPTSPELEIKFGLNPSRDKPTPACNSVVHRGTPELVT